MSYTRVNWQDAPSVSTPLTASNLNKMDAGIKQNTDDIEALQQLFAKNNEQFQLLFFENKDWDDVFAKSPTNSVSVIRKSGEDQYPFASNNYVALQWKNGSGAYGTQFVFGFGGVPAYRTCLANTWTTWQNLA